MLSFLPGPILAIVSLVLYTLAVFLLGSLFFILSIVWLITPVPVLRRKLKHFLFQFPSFWATSLRFTITLTTRTTISIEGLDNLQKDRSYLLIANHQAYLDIVVLQAYLDAYLPQIRYFMKQQLLWIPILGQACYLLGYPFMKRYSKKQIAANPDLKNKDLETTRKTCQRFKKMPITLANYVEGTRFTPSKRKKLKSPYQHLLRPKAGGVAFILSAMDKQIESIINVTIIYSERKHIDKTFLFGKMRSITIKVDTIPVTENLLGDYQNDPAFRENFQAWLNSLWAEKDQLIEKVKSLSI